MRNALPRTKLHAVLAPIAVICLIIATNGSDIAARMTVANESLAAAAAQSFASWLNPLAALIIAVPFIAAELLAVEVARYSNLRVAAVLFGLVTVALGLLYFAGYTSSHEAMLQHKWTEASLAVGLLPVQSLPILIVALVAGEVIRRRYKHEI
jgi:ABC-type phosphate/phosphonate transport system substrate-binding protein